MSPTDKPDAAMERLLSLMRTMLNKQFAMGTDEYREGVSDRLVKKHYDEARAAEDAFTKALRDQLAEARRANRALLEAIADFGDQLKQARDERDRLAAEVAELRKGRDAFRRVLEAMESMAFSHPHLWPPSATALLTAARKEAP